MLSFISRLFALSVATMMCINMAAQDSDPVADEIQSTEVPETIDNSEEEVLFTEETGDTPSGSRIDEDTIRRENPNEEANSNIPTEIMEEIIVTSPGVEFPNMQTFADRHLVDSRGEYYYRTRQYKKAFPYLLASAKQGFKMAQARLGFIYQQGLGEIPRDGWRAMGWLGVAAEGKTDPEIRNYYRKLRKKIPEELMPAVDAVIAEYTKLYGPDATGMECEVARPAGSHIARLICNFKDEFNFQDVNSMLEGNSTGAIPTGITVDATPPSTPPPSN